MKKHFLPFTLLLVTACQPESEIDVKKSISVPDVQEFYTANADHRQSRSNDDKHILWDNVDEYVTENGEYLLFNLDYQSDPYFLAQGLHTVAEEYSFAYAYLEAEEVVLEYVQIIPTEQSENFTGWVFVRDWFGAPKKLVEYANGEFVGYHQMDLTQARMVCFDVEEYTCAGDSRPPSPDCHLDEAYSICTGGLYDNVSDENSGGGSGDIYEPVASKGGGSGSGSTTCNPETHEIYNGQCVPKCQLGRNEDGTCIECPSSPCCGLSGDEFYRCLDDIPCPGDPLAGMDLTSPGASGTNGGRFGCTRYGSGCADEPTRKFHDGIDLTAPMGSYIFAAFPGTVVQIRNSFEAMQYSRNSYGNFIVIETTQNNGTKFRMKYNHLDYVSLQVGQSVGAGMLLGRTGTTGNASASQVIPHLHLQASVLVGSHWERTNPENYLTTAYDEYGNKLFDPCFD